jgi:hypothetical protein
MRVVRADDYGPQPELPWEGLIRSEMDTWVPERLPTNFRLRPRPHGRAPMRSAVWRRGAVTVAIASAVAAFVLTPMSSPVPGVIHMLLDSGTAASPEPVAPASVIRVPSGTPVSNPGETTPSQAAQPSAPAAHTSSRTATSAPARPAPTGSVLGGLLPPIVGSSTPAVPAPQVSVTTAAVTPTPAAPKSPPERHCLLGIICV